MIKRTLDEDALELFRKWGRKGGKKSKRLLTPEQAKAMVKAREAKKKKGRAK
jgi:hypothetical protein